MLMEDFVYIFLVDHSVKSLKGGLKPYLVCQKSEQPITIKSKFWEKY